MISDEVNANNVDVQSKIMLWLETMRRDIEKVNQHYGTNISVKYRFADDPQKVVLENAVES